MEDKKNIRVSGGGHFDGGAYGAIHISGGGHFSGDISADDLHISGGARFQGVDAREMHVSGSAQVDGALTGGEVHVSGGCAVKGVIDVDSLYVSGSLRGEKPVRGVKGQISGGVNLAAGAEFETLTLSGSAHVKGLLNAETLEITVSGQGDIAEIGGENIRVQRNRDRGNSRFLGGLLGGRGLDRLTCAAIEGTNVFLEDTVCDTVRGKNVVIGSGCKIARVEYAEELRVKGDGEVEEQIKV